MMNSMEKEKTSVTFKQLEKKYLCVGLSNRQGVHKGVPGTV